MRHWWRQLVVGCLLGSIGVVIASGMDAGRVEAACALMNIPTAEVTGIVTATTMVNGQACRLTPSMSDRTMARTIVSSSPVAIRKSRISGLRIHTEASFQTLAGATELSVHKAMPLAAPSS
jgi:hypothetical protein